LARNRQHWHVCSSRNFPRSVRETSVVVVVVGLNEKMVSKVALYSLAKVPGPIEFRVLEFFRSKIYWVCLSILGYKKNKPQGLFMTLFFFVF
jgi:hypothetical protein